MIYFAYSQLGMAAMHLFFASYFIKELFTEYGRRKWVQAGLWVIFNIILCAFDVTMGLATIRHG